MQRCVGVPTGGESTRQQVKILPFLSPGLGCISRNTLMSELSPYMRSLMSPLRASVASLEEEMCEVLDFTTAGEKLGG